MCHNIPYSKRDCEHVQRYSIIYKYYRSQTLYTFLERQ
nr:MAG TPA: hypothetical protein [Caudoviricetes sp.]